MHHITDELNLMNKSIFPVENLFDAVVQDKYTHMIQKGGDVFILLLWFPKGCVWVPIKFIS